MFVAKKPATSFSTRGIEFRDGGKKLRFTSPHLAPRSAAIFTEVNLVSTFFSKFAGFLRAMGFHEKTADG